MAGRQRGIVVPISATDNTDRAFEQVNARIAQLQQRVRDLTQQLSSARGEGEIGDRLAAGMQHAVPEIAAASGAIRELEGALPIRAVERFLTSVLGLGNVLAKAFPLVGAIALGGILKEQIEKFLQARREALELGETIRKAFETAVIATRAEADALALTNDKLEETLNKLSGHPAQGLTQGLDEARQQADKLYQGLDKVIAKLQEVQTKSQISFFQRVLGGQEGTDDLQRELAAAAGKIDQIKRENDASIQTAIDGGATSKNIQNMRDFEASQLEGVFKPSTDRIQASLKSDLGKQQDYQGGYGDGKDRTARINAERGALALLSAQQREIGEQYRNAALEPAVNQAQIDHEKVGAGDKAARAAKEAAEARIKQDDAERKAAETAAQDQLSEARLRGDLEVAELDAQHKRLLTSDQQYYAARAALRLKALEDEAAAQDQKGRAISQEIPKLQEERNRKGIAPTDRASLDEKIVDLQSQEGAIAEQRKKTEEEIAKVKIDAATQSIVLARQANEQALTLAAQVEQRQGGSTSARSALETKRYLDELNKLQDAPDSARSDAARLHQQNLAQINVGEAERQANDSLAGVAADRSGVDLRRQTGQETTVDARRDRNALDLQEASILQQLLAAQQAADAAGIEGSAAKVAQLKERIAELQTPVDEVAARLRDGFDSAFATLFENMGKGTKGLQEFGKSIEKLVLSEEYKNLIEPGIQQGLGAILPNRQAAGSVPGNGKNPSLGASLLGLIPGFGKIPGVGVKGSGAGDVTVQIINQGAPLTSDGATQQQSSTGQDAEFTQRVVSVVLKDAEGNGSIVQALSGIFGNL